MKRKLRVIHVVNVRWFNATAWYGLYLAKLMKQAGHEVMVLGLEGTASFEKAKLLGLDPTSLPLNTRNPFNYFQLIQSLSDIIVEFNPHIVNCHRGESFLLWCYLRMKHGFSLVRTRGDQRRPKKFFNRFLHNYCTDAIIATSTANTNAIYENLKVPEDKVSTIFGGVDPSLFTFSAEGRTLFRKQYNIPESAFVIGILGRFDHVKGQKELIQAFAKAQTMVPEGKELKLLLAGFSTTAVSEADIYQWIDEAGIRASAIVTGVCEDVPACISAMDLGVVASLGSEAIARAALEIMSTGVPLISTTVGVMPDLLPPWAMVEPGNINELAVLLCEAVNDAEWRERLREVNTTRMIPLSNESFLRLTIRVYREVLEKLANKNGTS